MEKEKKTGKFESQSSLQNKELGISEITVSEYRNGIPLSGFESVAAALHTFASGRSATETNLADNFEKQGGHMAVGLYFLATAGVDKDEFVEKILREAVPSLKTRGRWHGSWDYDAMGTPFFKSSVHITRLPGKNSYLLEMSAAYVGKEIESNLAKTLGVEQALQWKNVKLTFKPDGDSFTFDFDKLAKRLTPLYEELGPLPGKEKKGKPTLTGELMLQEMLPKAVHDRESESFALGVIDGIEVSLDLGSVGYRFDRSSKEVWKASGGTLTVPLAKSYEKKGELKPPSIIIDIRRHSKKDSYEPSLPAIYPGMKAKMNELANEVVKIFRD